MSEQLPKIEEEELTGLPPEITPDEPSIDLEDTLTGLPITKPENMTVFSTNDYSDKTYQEAERKSGQQDATTGDILGAAWDNVSPTQNVIDEMSPTHFDPDFEPTDAHWKELKDAGLSDDQQNDFYNVFSDQDWQTKKTRYEESLEADRVLAEAGWGGVAAQVLMSVLDPAALVAGALSGGTLNTILGAKRAASLGTASKIALQGGIAATENAALETILVNTKPTGEYKDVLYAALGGAAFGSFFGAAGRLSTKAEDDGIVRAINKAKDAIEDTPDNPKDVIGGSGSSVGAAHITSPNESINDAADDAIRISRNTDKLGKTAFSRARFDVTSEMKTSGHPLVQRMGNLLAEDGVGNVDGSVNMISASEKSTKLHGKMMLKARKDDTVNYHAWADEQGIPKWRSRLDKDRDVYNEQVTSGMRDEFPDISSHAMAQANSYRKFYQEFLYLAQNPKADEGGIADAVKGFENLTSNPHYVPRVHSPEKMTALISKFGQVNMGKAIGKAMQALNKELSNELADKIGRSYVKSIQRHQANSVTASRKLSGEDLEELREMLEESRTYDSLDMDDSDVDWIIDSLTKKEGADTKHGKRRLLFDEKFSVHMRPIGGGEPILFKMSDMFDNNAASLAENYSRTMSGEIALRQVGIGGKREVETTIQHIRDTASHYKDKNTMERDIKNIEYVATSILGRPVGEYGTQMFAARNSTFGKIQRRLADYNVIRVLGRVGEAQLVEIGNLLSTKNFKAFIQSMPLFRSFIRNSATDKELVDTLSRELEVATGIGFDNLHGSIWNNVDDLGAVGNRIGIDGVLEVGKRAVFYGSGMRAINNFLQRASMRTTVQRFANAAHTGDLDKAFSLKDLSAMGLTRGNAEEILGQIKKFSKGKKGQLSGERVHALNWDNWDLDIKSKFEDALYRDSRRAVQQNDVGTTHRFQGTPMGKMLFQFRSFLLSAWSKQTLHGLHKNDIDAYSKMALQSIIGSMVYVGQVHWKASQKDDPQEYINKKLRGKDGDEPWRVISAGFAKSGYSGFIPMGVDGALGFNHEDGIFNARSSGLSSTGLLSNPTLDLVDKATAATSGIVSSALTDDYQYSKVDAQALKALIPFQNARGIDDALNIIFKDLPDRSQDTYQY